MSSKKRKQLILEALHHFGGEATTRQIAGKIGLDVNGVSQTLGRMYDHVRIGDGTAGDTKWKVIKQEGLLF